MAKYKAQKTALYGVFRLISPDKTALGRVLLASFAELRDAEAWARAYAKEHFDCEMAVDWVDVKIGAWDGTRSTMTLLK